MEGLIGIIVSIMIVSVCIIISIPVYKANKEREREQLKKEQLKKEQDIKKAYEESNKKFIVGKVYYEDLANCDYMRTHVVYFYKILKREVVNHTDMVQTMKKIVIHLTADNQVISTTGPSIIEREIMNDYGGGSDFFRDLPCKYGFVSSNRANILTSTDKYINILPKEFLE